MKACTGYSLRGGKKQKDKKKMMFSNVQMWGWCPDFKRETVLAASFPNKCKLMMV